MNHDIHATGSPQQPGRRNARADSGRPSLFADFDQRGSDETGLQRVRLLSTLESQRSAQPRPSQQRRSRGRAHPWLTRALMVVMGLGMLVMLLSFIQLLRRPAPPPLAPALAAAATQAPPPASVAPAPAETVSAAAEIIEIEAPAAATPKPTASPTEPSTQVLAAALAAPQQSAKAKSTATATNVSPAAKASKADTGSATLARRDAPTAASSDDVDLVEALLAHAGPRKAPPTASEAFKQCGTTDAAAASTCRARVCVQHPALAACRAH